LGLNLGISAVNTYNDFKSGNADVKANIAGNLVGDIAQLFIGTGEVKAASYAMGASNFERQMLKFAQNAEKAELGAAKKGGRLGNSATRNQIGDIASTLESRGYTITGGGGRKAEEFLKPLGGGRKGGSFLDITATHPNYPTLRINTVDTYKSGLPTFRESLNAARIRKQIAPGEHLLLIPKK
jgi:hypothetical protein